MAALPSPREHARLDRRMVPRAEMALGVTLYRVGGEEVIPAAIANMSATGFLAELPGGVVMPEFLDVDLPNAGRRKAQVVWHGGSMAGCNFTVPLSRADLSAARLKSAFVEEQVVAHQPQATPLPRYELGPSDPIWDMLNEVGSHEKWSPGKRVALIAAAAILPWVPIAGLVAMLA